MIFREPAGSTVVSPRPPLPLPPLPPRDRVEAAPAAALARADVAVARLAAALPRPAAAARGRSFAAVVAVARGRALAAAGFMFFPRAVPAPDFAVAVAADLVALPAAPGAPFFPADFDPPDDDDEDDAPFRPAAALAIFFGVCLATGDPSLTTRLHVPLSPAPRGPRIVSVSWSAKGCQLLLVGTCIKKIHCSALGSVLQRIWVTGRTRQWNVHRRDEGGTDAAH